MVYLHVAAAALGNDHARTVSLTTPFCMRQENLAMMRVLREQLIHYEPRFLNMLTHLIVDFARCRYACRCELP